MMRVPVAVAGMLVLVGAAGKASSQDSRRPIIDVHLHAYLPADADFDDFPGHFRAIPHPRTGKAPAATTADEHMRATLAAMDEHNVVLGFVSGPLEAVDAWRAYAPDRFVGGPYFERAGTLPLEDLRRRFASGQLGLLGELGAQYQGLSPSDPQFDPYYALAEEMGIPLGVHTGIATPGTPLRSPSLGGRPLFRLRYGSPLLLEDLLVKHPALRVFAMHLGDPWLTDTLAMLWMYPELYVDVSVKNWAYPKEVFQRYLKALVDGGYGKRLMFGSDQIFWPENIGTAIEAVESADFLTEEQKADIFYNNAVRFFRLDPPPVAQ